MNKLKVLFLAVYCVPLISMQKSIDTLSCCKMIALIANQTIYTAHSLIFDDNYYDLAGRNSHWCLANKIAIDEDLDELDAYYHAAQLLYNGQQNTIFQTPLHQAILSGSMQSVVLLCNAGADKHKIIKRNLLENDILADTSYHRRIITLFLPTPRSNREIEAYNNIDQQYHIGCTALELAAIMTAQNKKDADQRFIYDYLLKH